MSLTQSFTIFNFPQISSQQKKRILVGVRPFRKGGIRLQKQLIRDKIIIHNYGHGGAGVSLAPSTAQQASVLVQEQQKVGQEVTILGSGIIGLLTAIQCINKGYRVKIYAERIPTLKCQAEEMCTSQVAPGYWLPYHYQFSDQKIHDIRSQKSLIKYLEWLKISKSVRKVQVFEDMDINQLKKKAPQFVTNTCKPVNLEIGQKKFKMTYFQTLQIHLQNFIQQLIQICLEKGARFQNKKLNSLDEALKLPTKIIVNCLGLGSKKVFSDENVYGIKGHLIQINNTSGIQGIFGFKFQGEPIKMYCFHDKILLGLTREELQNNEINLELASQLQKRAYAFYNSLGLKQARARL